MKSYAKPDLIVHGNVEDITLAIGSSPETDMVILSGNPLNIPGPGLDGSADLVLP
ncbi:MULTISPECIES: lasso peptide [unclassified Moorena]|uniref:lasso peptide n=1 Tax=unclassified Moorena TaxID=2683338 RepID=UPI0014000C07|nr:MULTISPECIES: lasso peptide [unclassified Moorena]NEO17529.1 lasso peptide [Moorena sp. SIO3E8]NEQ04059.1 lasso peptide [Moorena sp. SIO3F7]